MSTFGLQAACRGDRRRGLACPLERRAVDGVDALQLGDPLGGPLGLPDAARRRGAGRAPGRAAACRWSPSGRGGRAGSWSPWAWLLRRLRRHDPLANLLSIARGSSLRELAAIAREVVGCRACPRLVEWREQVARDKRAAFRDETYWGRPVPGFGDPAARIVVLGLAPPPTAPTAPAGCSPATAAATGCSARCTAPGSPTSRRRCRSTTGCAHRTRG